ncbi:MAG TPA: hypothetical protein PK400_12420, partial [Phycisphaerales bacterium]|nr:hypothetical protein [Phycisphaerales bacterium]
MQRINCLYRRDEYPVPLLHPAEGIAPITADYVIFYEVLPTSTGEFHCFGSIASVVARHALAEGDALT